VKGFCAACYFKQHPLIVLRRTPEAQVCPRCKAYYSSGRWIQQKDTSKADHLYSMVCDLLDPLFAPSEPATFEVELADHPPKNLAKAKTITVNVTAMIHSLRYQETGTVTIPVNPVLCTQCRQMAGGYFEAIIQVRTSAGRLTPEQAESIFAQLTQRLEDQDIPSSVLKIKETRGGFDVKCTSGHICKRLAKNLANTFGLVLGISSKVAGRTREGKTLRRDTYVLRFPPFQVGDVFIFKDQPHTISSLRNGRYTLTNLVSQSRLKLSPKDLMEIDAIALTDELHTFQVISEVDGVYQLMDQKDFTIYDLPNPGVDLTQGSMVTALEWENRLVLLPEHEE
jgi:nonsense-mediated mRNA decay protein 3